MPRARKLGQGDPRHTLQVATRPYLGRARNKGDNMVEMGEEIIRVEEVYKIFGPQPRGRAFDLVRSGVGKNEVHARTGHVVGLNDVNFDVKKGEIFVVMGLSGSGKSTAIRTVNKLLDTTHGQVVVDGTDVQKLDGTALQEFRREMTGMVFQHFALFPHRTVIDNVGYGLKVQGVEKTARDDASIKALSLVGLEAYAHYSPSQLSGGMQQRVGLARALAADPPILLMDEAFSALDPLIRRQMQDEMMEIQNELHKTILFITHDLNEALRIGDRVCIMKDGEVVQIGTPEEILILDWQLAIRSMGAFDVARLMGGSELPAERHGHQRDVLRTWHDALLETGVADYPWEDALRDLRLGALSAVCYPVHFHEGLIGATGRAKAVIELMCQRLFDSAAEMDAGSILPD